MTQACSLPSVTVIPLTLKQSRGRAWPTPIMDLRPILQFGFACRVLQADLDVGKKTVFMLPDDLALMLNMNALVPAIALAYRNRDK